MKEILARLLDGENLSERTMESTIGDLMDGKVSAVQTAALLTALRAKGETTDELVAAVRAMRARAVVVDAAGPLLDTCGTGGDGLGTFNVSTAAALVAAAGGARVAKHGNRAASSSVGAADVLEALGADIEIDPLRSVRAIDEVGFTFLFAPIYHPAFKHVAPVRRELGFRTLFNLTGPLCNPAGATRQVVGLFSAGWLEGVAEALGRLGAEHAMVVHGHGGADEILPTGPTRVVELRSGRIQRYQIDPSDFAMPHCSVDDLCGGSREDNAAIVREVLGGGRGPRSDAVALNAGAALYVAGQAASLAAGVERARAIIASAKGLEVLDAFVSLSKQGRS